MHTLHASKKSLLFVMAVGASVATALRAGDVNPVQVETTIVYEQAADVACETCQSCTSCNSTRKANRSKQQSQAQLANEKETRDVIAIMDQCYEGVSGFGIPKEQEELIIAKKSAPTYGEIEFESLKKLLDDIGISRKDVFYDFGSGVGKVCVQAYLDYPFSKVVGIELAEKRYDCAASILGKLEERELIDPKRALEFVFGDFNDVDASDATVIFMCSTCYSTELLTGLQEKFATFKPGLRVISLKALPDHEQFGLMLEREYKLPMTWSKDTGGSPVHVYNLVKKSKKSNRKANRKAERANRRAQLAN